jgi:predicted dehydrogenase
LTKHAVIIGYGSIGRRHHHLLSQMGWKVSLVSRHFEDESSYPHFDVFVKTQQHVDLFVIASPTHLHQEQLQACLHHDSTSLILVEKPLGFLDSPPSKRVSVGYNLRFHPLVQQLKQELQGENVLSLSIDLRRHLPTMRGEGVDYKNSYSCFTHLGGGVLRDFSHDLDLAQVLCGTWQRWKGSGGKFGNLHGDAMDTCTVIGATEHCPHVHIHMTYLDPQSCRLLKVVTTHKSFQLDLDGGALTDSNGRTFNCPSGLNDSYQLQLEATLTQDQHLCSLSEAHAIERLIHSIESSDA